MSVSTGKHSYPKQQEWQKCENTNIPVELHEYFQCAFNDSSSLAIHLLLGRRADIVECFRFRLRGGWTEGQSQHLDRDWGIPS